jgi:hypothetical protein
MRDFSDGPLRGHGFPLGTRPSIMWNHIDGAWLCFSDGQLHWLTWWEKFRCWMGWDDAESLQRKLRPRLTAILGMLQEG